MAARIFRPAKNAMQSGKATSHQWWLEFDPEEPRKIDPMMGYTSSGDMKQQIRMRFDTLEEAVAYAKRHNIPYSVIEPKQPKRAKIAYADNFRYDRRQPWTH